MSTGVCVLSYRTVVETQTPFNSTHLSRAFLNHLAKGWGVFPLASIALALLFAVAGPQTSADAASTQRSIREWVSCTGTEDDTSGAIEAFDAARFNAFTLVVDCPVRLHSGLAIDRGIFIDHDTTVEFTGAGKFIVDNMFHPAFIIANSSNIVLTNWNVEWVGSVPVDPNFRGYELGGKFVDAGGLVQPSAAFNDLVLTKWLETHRSIVFEGTHGWIKSVWVGGVNPSAVFFITGNAADVVFTGLKLYVPATAGGSHFMPVAFSLSQNWKSDQTVSAWTPANAQHRAVPHRLTFSGILLDGTLMGWLGNVRDTMFENIVSLRYGDLQDDRGAHVGGIRKWFPPPHLFYLNYNDAGDPQLFNSNIHIDHVMDAGRRVGVARDRGGLDGLSGYALSLKLGCTECSVDHYDSFRPDGFMDVLPSNGLTVSNVIAMFDSEFINNIFPAGLRFPAIGYKDVTFENIQMWDTAASTIRGPLGSAWSPTNVGIVFTNVHLWMNRWAGSGLPLPTIGGLSNNVSVQLGMSSQSMHVSHLVNGTVSSTLTVNPTTVRPGAATVLSWMSSGASSCVASGAWSGSVGTSGSHVAKVGAANNYDFNLKCANSAHASNTTLRVAAQ
jgi:hypothetical protein